MARKDVLKGLLEGATGPAPGGNPPAPDQPAPSHAGPDHAAVVPGSRSVRGAIGAVSQSIADLKTRAVIDLDPHMIDAGGAEDRLEHDPAEDAELARSIQEYGQQVPILVRPNPERPGRYQIVYGRRRVLATRDLGLPVKAMIRDLDDTGLLMAQGQENTVRRDLSFIEKCVFAQQLEAFGYGRKAICDALNVDKTLISRMLSIAEQIPIAAMRAIGAAPGIGRDRWAALAELVKADPDSGDQIDAMAVMLAKDGNSDARFEAAVAYMRRNAERKADDAARIAAPAPERGKTLLKGDGGLRLGEASHGKDVVVLRFRKARTKGFEDWLIATLPELHRQWEQGPDTPLPGDDEAP